ncbi:hypothetical protein [Microseira wollei]|uniref:SnoaL-like domain-containing protein n=1 Tax=Microseira wollei NIES-4236 TaxID=2530354 RepID=A0AAV3XTM2_9CYAN|nr:hypothetical protein [Microseira wollei]GET44272.1 hypothetical protein MiSe_90980 [Microseira wollei NIES-4236]
MKSIDDYLAAWNADTSEARHNLLINCMTADVIYLDPHVPETIEGIAGVLALIERFRERFDHRLKPEGNIDTHHHVFRLRWCLQRDTGEILSKGLMVGDLTSSQMIQRVIHFVD